MRIDEKYHISGMSCAACSARIDKAIRKLEGIKEVNVNLLTNSMVVTYDETVIDSSLIMQEVEKAGYSASLFKEEENSEKRTRFEKSIDEIRGKFGFDAITRGTLLKKSGKESRQLNEKTKPFKRQ